MKRLVLGFQMLRASARLVVRAPVLLVPGAVQALAIVVLGALVLRWGRLPDAEQLAGSGRTAVLMAVFLVGTTFTGVWSGAVVVVLAGDRMDGGRAGLRQAVTEANRHLPSLLGWSLVSATVGVVLQQINERLGPLGRWITGGLGLLFSLGTILVVPVLVVEGARPLTALRRSASLFRQRFGETASGQVGLEGAAALLFLGAVLLLACPAFAISVPVGLVVLGALFVAFLVAMSVLRAVFSTVLHRFATGQVVAGEYGGFAELFAPGPPRYTPSYASPHGQWDAS